MKTSIVVDIPPPMPYLEKFWFSSYGPKCCQPIRLQEKLMNDKVYFWHADKHQRFAQVMDYFGFA